MHQSPFPEKRFIFVMVFYHAMLYIIGSKSFYIGGDYSCEFESRSL